MTLSRCDESDLNSFVRPHELKREEHDGGNELHANEVEEEADEDEVMQEQGEQIGLEASEARVLRKPTQPTKAEREEHEISHVPFRSWCEDCVQGRGIESPHKSTGSREDDAVPLIGADYGFLADHTVESEERSEKMFTVLALGDTKSQSVKGIVVPRKGATDPWVIKRIAGWVD